MWLGTQERAEHLGLPKGWPGILEAALSASFLFSASKPLCSPGHDCPTGLGSNHTSKHCLKSMPLRPKAEFPGQRAQVA